MARMFRPAMGRDAVALRDLEKAANLIALAHVFPPETHPYPDQVVLDRWRDVLADPAVTTLVGEDERGLTSFAAFDAATCCTWGPSRPVGDGPGRRVLAQSTAPRLWCLEDNHRARRFYERRAGSRRAGAGSPSSRPTR